MKKILLILFTLISFSSVAQVDSLITKRGKVAIQTLLKVTGADSLTTHNMISGDTALQYTVYRDSIAWKKNFANITTGLKGAMLSQLKTEKYGTTGYDTHGTMGGWYSWVTRNYYNFSRPGEILYPYTYNMNNSGGAIISGEGAMGIALESDYNRGFEWYQQVETSYGLSYRPMMIVAKKDTIPGSEIGFKTPNFHIMYPDTAADFLSSKNGELSVYNITNRTSVNAAGTAIFRLQGYRGMNIYNNQFGLLFGGAGYYSFDSAVVPTSASTLELGGESAKWKKTYTEALQGNYKTPSDANYTLLISDYSLNFENITANRTLTLPTSFTGHTFLNGTRIDITTGQSTFKITFSGATVKNPDGTTATELPAGKSCSMVFNSVGASAPNWQIISTGTAVASVGTVTSVTGSGNIASSGGATPNITLTGTVPIANGGTNNGSLSVASGTVYYGDGTKLLGLAPGTSSQILHGGTTPSWKDTTAAGGGGGSVTSVSGTTNRITSSGGTTPAIDISATFEALLGKVANPLSQFASTTSSQLLGVLSDETGTGVSVFGTAPTFTTGISVGGALPDATYVGYFTGSNTGSYKIMVNNTSSNSGAFSTIALKNNTPVTSSLFLNSSANTLYGGASSLNVYAGGNTSFAINTNDNPRFVVTGSGNLIAGGDNVYDIGASGNNRPKTLWLGSDANVSGNVNLITAGSKLTITEGSNGRVGQTTLVAGTKAITITGLTTSSRAFIQGVSQGGTVSTTFEYAAVCTSNTLTITALTTGNVTNTLDTSTLNYFILN